MNPRGLSPQGLLGVAAVPGAGEGSKQPSGSPGAVLPGVTFPEFQKQVQSPEWGGELGTEPPPPKVSQVSPQTPLFSHRTGMHGIHSVSSG